MMCSKLSLTSLNFVISILSLLALIIFCKFYLSYSKNKEHSLPPAGSEIFNRLNLDISEILIPVSCILGANSKREAGDWSHTNPGFIRDRTQRIGRFSFYGRRLMFPGRHWIRHLAGGFRQTRSCSAMVSNLINFRIEYVQHTFWTLTKLIPDRIKFVLRIKAK